MDLITDYTQNNKINKLESRLVQKTYRWKLKVKKRQARNTEMLIQDMQKWCKSLV
jgi:hypothetical protein